MSATIKPVKGREVIAQLEKQKGGYCYLRLTAKQVKGFPEGKKTRLLCTLNGQLTFQCGLNHLGDGDFFIIIGSRYMKSLKLKAGDKVDYLLQPDPDPLGVPMPEVLEALLEQDAELKERFDGLTMGKKRFVIHSIARIKNIDLQVQRAIESIRGNQRPPHRGGKSG